MSTEKYHPGPATAEEMARKLAQFANEATEETK